MSLIGVAVLVLVLVAVAVLSDGDEPAREVALDPAAPSTTATTAPSATPKPFDKPPRTPVACRAGSGAFTPTSISVAGVTTGSPVVAVPRDSNGVFGVPPLTTAGREPVRLGRARGPPCGSPAGVVLLDAHTWPDGSALGNRLLDGLQTGGRLVVRGASGETVCYDVARREQVTAETRCPTVPLRGPAPAGRRRLLGGTTRAGRLEPPDPVVRRSR